MNRLGTILRVTALCSLVSLAAAPARAVEAPPADAGVDWRGPDGSTALQWAVYQEDRDRARRLIRDGADVDATNKYGANAMQLAAEVADTDMLELLLDAGADADSPNPEGQTTLMLVARTGNVEAAELLIDKGATVDARENWGEQTALMWAAARRHPAMMEVLIDAGADLDARSIARDYRRHLTKEGRAKSLDSGGLTPLMYAIRENCLACVEVLVDNDVNLDKPDPDGTSPLLLAIINSNWDIAKALIDAGADINQWDIFGQTPLHAVISRRNNEQVGPLDPLNETDGMTVLNMLLDNGANPNAQLFLRPAKQRGAMSRGTTPLIIAASVGAVDVIELLLEHGADATIMQADLQTPVSALAGARGNEDRLIEGLHMLADAGADLNVRAVPHHLQRSRGGTPFHEAVRAGNVKFMQALVDLGADINKPDIDGLTALDYAMSRGHVPFLRMATPPNNELADKVRAMGATQELDVTPFQPFFGPPFFYPWSIFPLDPQDELAKLVPGSFDHN